jgi:ribosomal protein S18 acetylase RimI-like enzyme
MTLKDVSADAGRIVPILADGFYDNPILGWVFPDPATRLDALTDWFSFWVEAYGDDARAFVLDDDSGAALWAVPGGGHLTDDQGGAYVETVRRHVGDRIGEVLGAFAAVATRPEPDHWYLNAIAAKRGQRARGLGARLLEPMLQRADGEQIPIYLESSNARNLTFYYRYGFTDLDAPIVMPNDGPVMQKMWREVGG